jgi:hypothetical protein
MVAVVVLPTTYSLFVSLKRDCKFWLTEKAEGSRLQYSPMITIRIAKIPRVVRVILPKLPESPESSEDREGLGIRPVRDVNFCLIFSHITTVYTIFGDCKTRFQKMI